MDIKLCRTCGRSGQNFTNIFKTDGLRNKIETCLPIVVSQHCLLPDTLCPECVMSVECFYVFTKSCLQNIIILEMKLNIQESCLKAKRKKDKSCIVRLPLSSENKCSQTEDYLNVLLGQSKDFELFHPEYPLTTNFLNTERHYSKGLVDYDLQTDSSSNSEECNTKIPQPGSVILGTKLQTINIIKNVVDNIVNSKSHGCDYLHKLDLSDYFVNEITERKNSKKRKSDEGIESLSPKFQRKESGNKRKCSNPKRLEKSLLSNGELNDKGCGDEMIEVKKEVGYYDASEEHNYKDFSGNSNSSGEGEVQTGNILYTLPQHCLLCNIHLDNPAALAEHFMKIHVKERSSPNLECGELDIDKKKRNIPSLLKISDLRRGESFEDSAVSDSHTEDEGVTHQNNNSCPNCPAVFSTKSELFVHLQLNHSEISTYLCGICLKQTNSLKNLRCHVMDCLKNRPVTSRYFCEVCCFGDENYRTMERHVLVHNFLWKDCQKEVKNFDPEDYIQKNPNFVSTCASPIKNFSCLECSRSDFDTFRKFSTHRRNEHSIFHCDLCNKHYGRNSHLWKHVNRVHKNHPSITCQVCFKTSASKYHLAQHFTKTHQTKPAIKKSDHFDNLRTNALEDRGAIRTLTLRKQESTDQEIVNTSFDENSLNQSSQSEYDNSMDHNVAPKEIDPTHDLYANILTNYSPRKTEGNYKCAKCSKGFHKRMLLRKHKKNCRPKLQKDLLTRCKTCARVFKDRQSLAKHLINYHSDYECEICNEKVPSKCEIVSHIRFQHPSSHLICTVCDNILRCKKDLLEHLVDHENSFVCQFCGDALASKVKLKMHILSLHRKILSLSCGICLKLFETQQVLRNHVTLIHKEQLVPLMSCPICGKNYGSKWKTFDHVNKSHGRFFKACKTCLEIYETEDQLLDHIGIVHQNQQPSSNNNTKVNPATATRASGLVDCTTLNNGGNDFDTDSEGSTEETENSPSSESEGDENSRQHKADNQRHPSEENVPSFPTQENKISLLEKRLLGKAIHQTDKTLEKNVAGTLYKSCFVNNAKTNNSKLAGDATKEVSVYPIIKKEEENSFLGRKAESNISHHSKRTVYENSNDPSFCEICHKTWPAKKHLWQHYIRCHKRAAATVCGICLKTNNSYESLQIHLRETHPTLLHGQGYGSNFICRICGRYHNASSKLRLHMAIHEKFDWALLEKFPAIPKSNVKTVAKENGIQPNGDTVNENDGKYFYPTKVEANMNILMENEDIFDAMIEQVEESTSSSVTETGNRTQDSSTDTNSGYEPTNINRREEGVDSENRLSFSNLLQTLKYHNQFQAQQDSLNEKPADVNLRAQSVIRISQGSNVTLVENVSGNSVTEKQRSYLSEESSSNVSDCGREGDANSGNELHQLAQVGDIGGENYDNVAHVDHHYDRNIFRPKPEELDSAIKSISDHCDEPQIKTEYGDFSESVQQGNCLNETEIESAVGSIL